MAWGAMGGLGEGLGQVGQLLGDIAKTKMAEKLDRQREEARDAREQRRYDPSQDSYEVRGGAGEELWYKIRRNKAGEVIGQDLAPKNIIEQMKAEADSKKRAGELQGLQIQSIRDKSARDAIVNAQADADRALLSDEERAKAARIAADLAPGAKAQLQANTSLQTAMTRAGGRTSRDEEPLSDSPILAAKERYASEIKSMMKEYGLSDSQMDDAIGKAQSQLIASAKANGTSIKDVSGDKFIRWLRAQILTDHPQSASSSGGGIKLNLAGN